MEYQLVETNINKAFDMLRKLNPNIAGKRSSDFHSITKKRPYHLQKVLVANRGEIAKRFFLALHEEGIPSVAVVTDADKGQTWYEFADEVVFIGDNENYANISIIIASAYLVKANAIYTGYGFLSENAEFVHTINFVSNSFGHEIIFMGPNHNTMRMVGNKINARTLAREHNIPLFESSDALNPNDKSIIKKEAERIGYPIIIKLASGGGGKGMYPVFKESELDNAIESSIRIGKELYNDCSFYIEKYIVKPIHMEVQIFNGQPIGIRKCAIQRRNQKIIEESGHTFLDESIAQLLLTAAEKIANVSGYSNGGGAGTVEFLIDNETGKIGFMEMNTRLQVEYAVTDQSLGIDLAKWQILFFDGREHEIIGLDIVKDRISKKNHSIECRIYAEDPENGYLPSPGTIVEMDLPTFNGIRCDLGFSEGDNILPMYDPMIGKLIAHGSTRNEAIIRLERALQEFFIKGVKTNINQLLKIIRHPEFIEGNYTNNFLSENNDLNFNESVSDEEKYFDRRESKHIIFGAFSEYIRFLQHSIREFMIIANIQSIFEIPLISRVPYKYRLKYNNVYYSVEFIQISLDEFHVYINSIYSGKITIISVNDRSDDFLLIFGNNSFRVRVNRYVNYIELRMKDEKNKINYYKMTIEPEGIENKDKFSVVASPFQGTFISFSNENIKIGNIVKAGDPIIILSAMKMETTIYAPIDGKIVHLIEDGDISRLQISKRADGRIIGKSIQEGEILVKIESEAKEQGAVKSNNFAQNKSIIYYNTENILDILYKDNFDDMIIDNQEKYFDQFVNLLYSAELGFIQQPHIIEKILQIMKKIPDKLDDNLISDKIIDKINASILHYTYIKKIFSPVLSNEGFSYQEELDQYIANWQNFRQEQEISDQFKSLLLTLFNSYSLPDLQGRSEFNAMIHQYIFLLFKLSYHFCLDHTDIIKKLVHIISNLKKPSEHIFITLKKLLEQEQAELDDSLLKYIKKIISEKFTENNIDILSHSLNNKNNNNYNKLSDTIENDRESTLIFFKESIRQPDKIYMPEIVPIWFADHIQSRLSLLDEDFYIKRLYSPLLTIIIYQLKSKEDLTKKRYIAFSYVNYESGVEEDDPKKIITNALSVIQVYQNIEICSDNWLDITIKGKELLWNIESIDNNSFKYEDLIDICTSALNYFNDTIAKGIINIDVRIPLINISKEKSLLFYRKDDSILLDLLLDSDKNHPYFIKKNSNLLNQRLFNATKWPVEIWAEECFDPDSVEELIIKSIDEPELDIEAGDKKVRKPIGAKILYGNINGKSACFYMKDSRISGGSTGSKEGLKYVAAAYISYINGWPLYVWNDSAGANILEGVISLNRGAEGFMMNSLLTERADQEKFRNYMMNTSDEVLRNLFNELNHQFNLSFEKIKNSNKSFQLIAVGTGSSAGLDVYGSSQASIQLLLDSEQSYRVLTGSNVIRSVIGEDISNYDIGGAKILGKWTGIVDIIAKDKIHLINYIHQIHDLFGSKEQLPGIKRIETNSQKEESNNLMILNESIIMGNVDNGQFWQFKEDYYGAEALIGGFAKIGGRRVLIMGPRTHSGLRSLASITKAKELLKIARRTFSHQIIIFGKKWEQSPDYHENISMRSRLDFMNTIQHKSCIKINIITDFEGLKSYEINSAADVIIYMHNKEISPVDLTFVKKNATFITSSYEESFDLSLRLINMIDPLDTCGTITVPLEKPEIPKNSSTPYDIIESVITKVFDLNTFIEFYSDMNNPDTGPHLITGLAQLNGTTVGIIADQPLVKGGGADAFGTEKFRIFTEFLNRTNIPLIMLSNSSGFVPGSKQERYRIQAIGAESLDANILGEIPVVSVVLNQNFGGRLIHAFNKFLRPGIIFIALSNAIMAVIGADAAFDLLYGKKFSKLYEEGNIKEAKEIKDSFFSEYLNKAQASNDAKSTGLIDWEIDDISYLREHLIKGLKQAFYECNAAFNSEWPVDVADLQLLN